MYGHRQVRGTLAVHRMAKASRRELGALHPEAHELNPYRFVRAPPVVTGASKKCPPKYPFSASSRRSPRVIVRAMPSMRRRFCGSVNRKLGRSAALSKSHGAREPYGLIRRKSVLIVAGLPTLIRLKSGCSGLSR